MCRETSAAIRVTHIFLGFFFSYLLAQKRLVHSWSGAPCTASSRVSASSVYTWIVGVVIVAEMYLASPRPLRRRVHLALIHRLFSLSLSLCSRAVRLTRDVSLKDKCQNSFSYLSQVYSTIRTTGSSRNPFRSLPRRCHVVFVSHSTPLPLTLVEPLSVLLRGALVERAVFEHLS